MPERRRPARRWRRGSRHRSGAAAPSPPESRDTLYTSIDGISRPPLWRLPHRPVRTRTAACGRPRGALAEGVRQPGLPDRTPRSRSGTRRTDCGGVGQDRRLRHAAGPDRAEGAPRRRRHRQRPEGDPYDPALRVPVGRGAPGGPPRGIHARLFRADRRIPRRRRARACRRRHRFRCPHETGPPVRGARRAGVRRHPRRRVRRLPSSRRPDRCPHGCGRAIARPDDRRTAGLRQCRRRMALVAAGPDGPDRYAAATRRPRRRAQRQRGRGDARPGGHRAVPGYPRSGDVGEGAHRRASGSLGEPHAARTAVAVAPRTA